MSRICKKCLIGQEAGDYLALIEKNRAATPQKVRASDQVYDHRIQTCEACEKLSGPTCLACGCYVELRALRKDSRCPYNKW